MERVSYVHDVKGKYTLAYTVEPALNGFGKQDRIKVNVGVAWCSPRDNFNRRIGRTVAGNRLSHPDKVPHKHEIYLSGKLPSSGYEWRSIEGAVKEFIFGVPESAQE